MDGDVLSLSSSSSLSAAAGTQEDVSPKRDSSLPHKQQGHKSAEELWYVPYVLHFYIRKKQKHIIEWVFNVKGPLATALNKTLKVLLYGGHDTVSNKVMFIAGFLYYIV